MVRFKEGIPNVDEVLVDLVTKTFFSGEWLKGADKGVLYDEKARFPIYPENM